jgi:hypothetical protein
MTREALQQPGANIELLRSHLEQDIRFKNEYLELFYYFSNTIEKPLAPLRHIVAFFDEHRLIQGFCDFEAKKTENKVKSVYIHTIFTASWNLKMKSPVPYTHAGLVTKGVGIALIREAYIFAHAIEATLLKLKPLPNSESFYMRRLRMTKEISETEQQTTLTLPICEALPEQLL